MAVHWLDHPNCQKKEHFNFQRREHPHRERQDHSDSEKPNHQDWHWCLDFIGTRLIYFFLELVLDRLKTWPHRHVKLRALALDFLASWLRHLFCHSEASCCQTLRWLPCCCRTISSSLRTLDCSSWHHTRQAPICTKFVNAYEWNENYYRLL